jgi:hypothetical protein
VRQVSNTELRRAVPVEDPEDIRQVFLGRGLVERDANFMFADGAEVHPLRLGGL